MSDTNATPAASTTEVSLYGPNAILSSDAPSAAELALIDKAKNVEVRDGDQLVDVQTENPEGDPEGDPEANPEGNPEENPEGDPQDKPEDGSDDDIQAKTKQAQTALEDVGKDLQGKGVDVQAIMTEFEAGNGLSEKTYETLGKAGYSKAVVDSIIAGQVAVANSFTNSVLAHAGGAEGFQALTALASQATRNAFNEAVNRGDLGTAKALLDGLKAQRTAKLGTQNPQLKGNPATRAGAVQGFANRGEMTAAMRDPKYGRDPVYTRQVEAKVGASSFF